MRLASGFSSMGKRKVLLGGVVGILGLLFVGSTAAYAATGGHGTSHDPTSANAWLSEPSGSAWPAYPNLPLSKLPLAKQRDIVKTEHMLEQAHGVAKSSLKPPVEQVAAPQRPQTGIFPTAQAPFAQQWFSVQNSATTVVDGSYFTVYAGVKKHPSTGAAPEAAVVVYRDPANVFGGSQPQKLGVYFSGTGSAPLKIVRVDAGQLALVSSSGQMVRFDVQNQTFQAS